MSFAFGNTPAKTTGFGTSFGTPTTSTTGGFGTSFGATTTQQPPAFGSTFGATAAAPSAFGTSSGALVPATSRSFGSAFFLPASSAPPSFGTTFGAPASSAPPSFGSTFGAPATSAAPAFGTGFGAQQEQPSLFGTTAAKPSLFGTTTPSTTGLFGGGATGGLFGSTSTTQGSGLFGSTATSTAPSLFGTSSTPSLFGQPSASTASTPFGATNTAATGFGGLFGTNQPASTPSLFGTGFGAATSTAAPFGGFGTTSTGFGGFGTQATHGTGLFGSTFGAKPGQPLPGQIPQTPASKSQQVIASVYAINVFNDERDGILKKWNMLQACWGTGKGYYNSSQPPVDYDVQNPFYRFRAIGYNVIPEQDDSDGIVKLIFNKKISELKNQQEVLKNGIGGILGNKPNLSIEINQIRAISDNQTEVKISVSEKGVTGCSRKIPASDLSTFLNQPMPKQQLSSVGISSVTPFVTPTKAELEEYLKHPPAGIDAQMWQAAIQDNPNPKKYIPVPINGFADLRSRMLHQEHQTGLHQAFLERVNKDITELKTRHSSSIAQITDLKSKFLELQHRILRVLVKQESSRKLGIAIQPEEELLRGRLEMMHQHLNNPKQFKGQVNELLSNVKLMEGTQKQNSHNYRLDAEAQDEIKQLLKMEQGGIAQLINVIQTDLEALNIINAGMKQITQNFG